MSPLRRRSAVRYSHHRFVIVYLRLLPARCREQQRLRPPALSPDAAFPCSAIGRPQQHRPQYKRQSRSRCCHPNCRTRRLAPPHRECPKPACWPVVCPFVSSEGCEPCIAVRSFVDSGPRPKSLWHRRPASDLTQQSDRCRIISTNSIIALRRRWDAFLRGRSGLTETPPQLSAIV